MTKTSEHRKLELIWKMKSHQHQTPHNSSFVHRSSSSHNEQFKISSNQITSSSSPSQHNYHFKSFIQTTKGRPPVLFSWVFYIEKSQEKTNQRRNKIEFKFKFNFRFGMKLKILCSFHSLLTPTRLTPVQTKRIWLNEWMNEFLFKTCSPISHTGITGAPASVNEDQEKNKKLFFLK